MSSILTDLQMLRNNSLIGLNEKKLKEFREHSQDSTGWEREMERSQMVDWFKPQDFPGTCGQGSGLGSQVSRNCSDPPPRGVTETVAQFIRLQDNFNHVVGLKVNEFVGEGRRQQSTHMTLQQQSSSLSRETEKAIERGASLDGTVVWSYVVERDTANENHLLVNVPHPHSFSTVESGVGGEVQVQKHTQEHMQYCERSLQDTLAGNSYGGMSQAWHIDAFILHPQGQCMEFSNAPPQGNVTANAQIQVLDAIEEHHEMAGTVATNLTTSFIKHKPDTGVAYGLPFHLYMEGDQTYCTAWLAIRQSDPNWQAWVARLVTELKQALRERGQDLVQVICNGRVVWCHETKLLSMDGFFEGNQVCEGFIANVTFDK